MEYIEAMQLFQPNRYLNERLPYDFLVKLSLFFLMGDYFLVKIAIIRVFHDYAVSITAYQSELDSMKACLYPIT
jgi:hypothetical protein